MICIIALIVFGVLGAFSAKYRLIAKEALDCVFRKVTLRKCESRLDSRLKAEISGKLMRHWRAGGSFLYKYFEWFSWIFLILTVATLFFMGQGIYYFAVYGNCNGPDSNEFCIFDPMGTSRPAPETPGEETGALCSLPEHVQGNPLAVPPPSVVDEAVRQGLYAGNPDAQVVIVEFGCYSCHYTRKVESTVQRVIKYYGNDILYVYRDFPLTTTHPSAFLAAEAAHCALDQGAYWEYRALLFAHQGNQTREHMLSCAHELDLDLGAFGACLDSDVHEIHVNAAYQEGLDSGITVTPTFFINNETLVGAKTYKEFAHVIDRQLGKKTFWERIAFWN